MGRDVSAEDYKEGQRLRVVLRAEVDAALANCDGLVLPTLPIPAPVIGAATVRVGHSDEAIRPLTLRLTQLFNLTGHPAVSLPCGDAHGRLPCGLQFVGHLQATTDLLSLALACEPQVTIDPPRCAGRF